MKLIVRCSEHYGPCPNEDTSYPVPSPIETVIAYDSSTSLGGLLAALMTGARVGLTQAGVALS